MIWAKSANELSDQDVRHVLWQLLERQRTLEVHLAEVVALLLFSVGTDGPEMDEDQYQSFVDQLTGFLSETNEHLRRTQQIEAQYESDVRRAEQN